MNRIIITALISSLGLFACKGSESADKAPPAAASKKAASAPAAAAAAPAAALAEGDNPDALMDPSKATLKAPAKFAVKLDTTKGPIFIDVTREWAPHGADRIYNLVKAGYLNDVAFFRVIEGFMAQVGINGNPEVNKVWRNANMPDDPVTQSNTKGMVTFAAASMPNSRTTQFFINFGNNTRLDGMRFAPFGKVRDMEPVEALYSGYGEGAPSGRGPNQSLVQSQGNKYLRASFPELDYIKSASIIPQ